VNKIVLNLYLLTALSVLSACASKPAPQPPPPTERESLDRSARLAFTQGQYAQATTLYDAVLQKALAEDAAGSIIDARFNLALCQTYQGEYQDALMQIAQAEAERVRRGLPIDPDLQLLAGTIYYRAGEVDRALATLDAVLEGGRATPVTEAKAHFVSGLIAADRSSSSALEQHIAALPLDATGSISTDRLELKGRLAGLEGDLDVALQLFEQVATLRSLERDYRGMVRALASAGDLAESGGRFELAGNYFLRAGRSAAQRDEPETRIWLQRARELGRRVGDEALVREADTILGSQ